MTKRNSARSLATTASETELIGNNTTDGRRGTVFARGRKSPGPHCHAIDTVALVTPVVEGPTFVEFVRARELEGLRGTQLVIVIEERYRTIGIPADLDVVAPRVVEVSRDTFIPGHGNEGSQGGGSPRRSRCAAKSMFARAC